MRQPLTKKQSKVYEYIRHCITDKRYSPSGSEISRKFGYANKNGVWDMVNRIIKKDWVSRDKNRLLVLGRSYYT